MMYNDFYLTFIKLGQRSKYVTQNMFIFYVQI